jgi:uncharacterized protein (TIGR00251 family)
LIDLKEHAGGVLLPVKAQPGGRRNAVVGEHGGALKVMVTAAPEKGKANAAIIEVLAEAIGLRKGDLALLRGESSSEKTFVVSGMTSSELADRLAGVLAQASSRRKVGTDE